ncbi:MAG: serine/threonine-protein kinase [Polyangiaceae bacterium]
MESQASSEGEVTTAGAPALSSGALLAGKYRVRRHLDGARGVLLEAVQETVDLRVVVQVLPADRYDALERERFRREASALVRLESEHAARILDVGALEDGSLFSVRQYLDGEPLDTWAARSERVPVEEAVLLVLQAADAVAEAHGHGVVLRELSPGHLFVSRRPGGAAMVRVVDFGMAKLARDPRVTEEVTAVGLLGLSPYASPEMVRRSRLVDVRSDVWSLGAILHLLLGGRPPFEGDESELMLAILKERPRALAAERGDVPRALDEVLRWAMAKDLDERFRDVHALAHALEPFASAEGKVLVARIAQTSAEAKRRRRQAVQEERARGAADRAAIERVGAPEVDAPATGAPEVAVHVAEAEAEAEAAPAPAASPVPERRPATGPRASNASEEITRAAPLPDPRTARRGSDAAAEAGSARGREAGQALRPDPQRAGPTFAGAAADMRMPRADVAQPAHRPMPSPRRARRRRPHPSRRARRRRRRRGARRRRPRPPRRARRRRRRRGARRRRPTRRGAHAVLAASARRWPRAGTRRRRDRRGFAGCTSIARSVVRVPATIVRGPRHLQAGRRGHHLRGASGHAGRRAARTVGAGPSRAGAADGDRARAARAPGADGHGHRASRQAGARGGGHARRRAAEGRAAPGELDRRRARRGRRPGVPALDRTSWRRALRRRDRDPGRRGRRRQLRVPRQRRPARVGRLAEAGAEAGCVPGDVQAADRRAQVAQCRDFQRRYGDGHLQVVTNFRRCRAASRLRERKLTDHLQPRSSGPFFQAAMEYSRAWSASTRRSLRRCASMRQ